MSASLGLYRLQLVDSRMDEIRARLEEIRQTLENDAELRRAKKPVTIKMGPQNIIVYRRHFLLSLNLIKKKTGASSAMGKKLERVSRLNPKNKPDKKIVIFVLAARFPSVSAPISSGRVAK